MSRLRLWQVTNDRPVVLDRRADFLEKHLESWIETTPSMVAEDMEWVARQMHLPDGSILDLLGVTPEGQWVVAELKQGPVGVSTLAQVLHYGLYIGSISGEELVRRLNSVSEERRTELHEQVAAETDESPRQLQLLLVGTNSDVDLTDAVEFLGKGPPRNESRGHAGVRV